MNPSLLRSYHHSQSLKCFCFWKYNCFINFFVVFYFDVINIATLNILYLTWNKINISVLNNINLFLKRQIFEKLNLNWLGGINTLLQNLRTTIFKIWSFYYFAITFSFFCCSIGWGWKCWKQLCSYIKWVLHSFILLKCIIYFVAFRYA